MLHYNRNKETRVTDKRMIEILMMPGTIVTGDKIKLTAAVMWFNPNKIVGLGIRDEAIKEVNDDKPKE